MEAAEGVTLLAEGYDAALFSLEGVVTAIAPLETAAWGRLFPPGNPQTGPIFLPDRDYYRHFYGRPPHEGVVRLFAEQGTPLEVGDPRDPPYGHSAHAFVNRWRGIFRERLEGASLLPCPGLLHLLHALRGRGLLIGLIGTNPEADAILRRLGLSALFDARLDGQDLALFQMKGSDSPEPYIELARRIEVPLARMLFFTAWAEEAAGAREAGCAEVIGVGSEGAERLLKAGAARVVGDLDAVRLAPGVGEPARAASERAPALPLLDILLAPQAPTALFFDYDGTLTPIVPDPKRAKLPDETRELLARLAALAPVAIISGRDLDDLMERVGVAGMTYAGSHGFDIAGPGLTKEVGRELLPVLDFAESALRERLGEVEGVLIERKRFAVAVHYRRVQDGASAGVLEVVRDISGVVPGLRERPGKMVVEIQPDLPWDKGRALEWILGEWGTAPSTRAIYVGDDQTDEDAFLAIEERGVGILVTEEPTRPSSARYFLHPDEVHPFLVRLAELLERRR